MRVKLPPGPGPVWVVALLTVVAGGIPGMGWHKTPQHSAGAVRGSQSEAIPTKAGNMPVRDENRGDYPFPGHFAPGRRGGDDCRSLAGFRCDRRRNPARPAASFWRDVVKAGSSSGTVLARIRRGYIPKSTALMGREPDGWGPTGNSS